MSLAIVSNPLWDESLPFLFETPVIPNSILGYLGQENSKVTSCFENLLTELLIAQLDDGIHKAFTFKGVKSNVESEKLRNWATFIAQTLPYFRDALTEWVCYKEDGMFIDREFIYKGPDRTGWLLLNTGADVILQDGARSQIRFAVNILTGQLCTHKQISLSENDCMSKLRQIPEVASPLACVVRNKKVNILQTFCPYGSLRHYLNEKLADPATALTTRRFNLLSLRQRMKLGIDLLKGMAAMHKLNMVHADLKPENILIEENEMGDKARLIDFETAGLAGTQNEDALWTARYAPPESRLIKTRQLAYDCYSIGLILYELAEGDLFDNKWVMQCKTLDEYFGKILSMGHPLKGLDSQKRWEVAPACDKPLYQVIHNLLLLSPEARMTAATALEILEKWYKDTK